MDSIDQMEIDDDPRRIIYFHRFAALLSKDMTYSCAIFENYEEDLQRRDGHVSETLEDAQLRKLR